MAKRKKKDSYAVSQQRRMAEEKKQQARQNQIIATVAGIIAVAIFGFLLWQVGSSGPDEESAAGSVGTVIEGERPLAALDPLERNQYYSSPPEMIIDTDKTYEAVIQTAKGDIRLALFDDQTPITVNNFVFLANQGFYDGTTFHRVLAGFMAQAGDPTGTGAGGPGYEFEDEIDNTLRFDRAGLLAMANPGAPNTNGSQFFITYAPHRLVRWQPYHLW